MIVPNHRIGLIGAGVAIRPLVLYPLPPGAQAVQADAQEGHGRHPGHQVHRPVPAPSPGSAWLWSGSLPGEALEVQLLWRSGQHGLPPVLLGQRVLVADAAAWWAGIRLVILRVVRR